MAIGTSRKQALREDIRIRLRGLTCASRASLSASGTQQLLSLPELARAKSVYLFASLPSEIDTDAAFAALRAAGKRVAVPRMKVDLLELEAVYVGHLHQMQLNLRGVREPIGDGDGIARPEELDVFIVPGVAFDRHGRRLGRGQGYYDRFLAKHRNQQSTVGFFYSLQEAPEVPVNARDQHIDIVVTDKEVIRCHRSP